MKKSTKWFIVVFLPNVLLSLAHKLSAPFFECGPHGRFEYCIDGIPGCIVGCHCHPGYYFDTETKVCEPNHKLRLDYRRQYIEELTPTPSITTELSPTPTTTLNIIDKNVDAIAKDADDLGDWLYNQFFKTIENQVINKTNEGKQPTRRSESDIGTVNEGSSAKPVKQPNVKVQRRSRRKHRKRSSKKKHSKKGLRRKLLRISEDDSLFDSSSGSSSSESGSSHSSESCESESSISRESSRDHGRKIIMINKKPVPPLPSFIFLPNMETPYFPPLGLPPPPPPIPMYPMIPVPPVIPVQMMPVPSSTSQTTEASQTTAAQQTTAPTQTTAPPQTQSSTEKPNSKEDKKPDEENDQPKEDTRSRSGRKFRAKSNKWKGSSSGNKNARDRFINRIQEKMKKKFETPQRFNYFPHELIDPAFGNMHPELENMHPDFENIHPDFENEHPVLNPAMHSDYDFNGHPELTYGETSPNSKVTPYNQNVNFKYLSQLIHKMNKTDYKPNLPPQPIKLLRQNYDPSQKSIPMSNVNSKSNLQNFKTFPIGKNIPLRRTNNDALIVNYTMKSDYADLGRQIASLVRKIDAKGEREIDVSFEGEKTTGNIIPQAMFNNNGLSSRSYWERFARSPFKIRFNTDNFIHVDSSEKLQLLSLEDQVNSAATTPRSLTLHQLENIISLIERIKSVQNKQLAISQKPKAPTKLNLMTTFPKVYQNPIKVLSATNVVKFDSKPKNQSVSKPFYEARLSSTLSPVALVYKKTQTPKLNVTLPEIIPKGLIRVSDTHNQRSYAPQRFKIPLSRLLQHAAIHPMSAGFPNKNLQFLKPKIHRQSGQQQHLFNHNNLPSYNGVYHHYDNVIQDPNFSSGTANKPSSYFHHQVHHFDYFD